MTRNAALLFDLDGTLVDSDVKHMAAFSAYSRALSVDQSVYNRSIQLRVERSDWQVAAGLAVVGMTTNLRVAELIAAGATLAANDFTDRGYSH